MEAAISRFNRKPAREFSRRRVGRGRPVRGGVLSSRTFSRGVDPVAAGEFLGSAEAARTTRAFVDAHDFVGAEFDVALRAFLGGPFRLPGEAQKIDRVMEAFAARYCRCNPGVFATPDAAYVLAFAVIMLNTDAHNPTIDGDARMSEEDFIAMATSTEEGGTMDRRVLAALYTRRRGRRDYSIFGAQRGDVGRRRPPRTLLRETPRGNPRPPRTPRPSPPAYPPARLQGVSSPRPRPRGGVGGRASSGSRVGIFAPRARAAVSTRRPNPVWRVPCWRRRARLCYARWRPRSRTPRTPRTPRFRSRARARRYDSRRIYARTPRRRICYVSRRRLGRWNETGRNGHPRRGGGSNARGTRGEGHGRARRAMGAAIEVICRVDALRSRPDSDAREDARDASAVRAPLRTANDDTFKGDDSDSKDVAVSIPKTSPFRVPKTSPFRGRRRRRGDDRARGAERRRETFGRVVVERRGNRRDERGVLGVDATRHRRSHRVRRRARARRARVHLWADADASSDGNVARARARLASTVRARETD